MSTPLSRTIPLPPANAVARMLTDLVGRTVKAKTVPASPISPGSQMVGTYLGECGNMQAVICCDLPAGGSLAAALTVIPAVRVDDCIKKRNLDETLTENLHEILNVLAAVFPQNGARRVIFRDLFCGADIPPDIKAILSKPPSRLDLEIDVAGYRSGKFTILGCAVPDPANT